MKKAFICYVDMDGVLNLFESDKNARINMWNPGYFINIPVRYGISDLLQRINEESYVVILSKVINRVGVTKEKIYGLKIIFHQMHIVILFMYLMIEANLTICFHIIHIC